MGSEMFTESRGTLLSSELQFITTVSLGSYPQVCYPNNGAAFSGRSNFSE